jgi:hypothetical protein
MADIMIVFLLIVAIFAILYPSSTRGVIETLLSVVGWFIIIMFAIAIIGLIIGPVA